MVIVMLLCISEYSAERWTPGGQKIDKIWGTKHNLEAKAIGDAAREWYRLQRRGSDGEGRVLRDGIYMEQRKECKPRHQRGNGYGNGLLR